MRNPCKLFLNIFLVILTACNFTGGIANPSQPPEVPIAGSSTTPVRQNLALEKTVTASAQLLNDHPEYAVDGNPGTIWNSGANAPQWIQIDLGMLATITQIRLTIAQSPDGRTIHDIFLGSSPSNMTLIHHFDGDTSDNQTLEFNLLFPLPGIRFIKVLTSESPSWVAWKEIEINGEKGEQVSSTEPVRDIADRIYTNGTILTMEKGQPNAQAIAIKGDRILAVGSESEVMQFNGEGTELIDLNGMTMTPGFIDSHAHRIGDRWHFGDVSAEQMMEKALSQGWTSIHELFVTDQRLAELESLARANALPLRISMYLTTNFEYDESWWWQAYQPLHQYSPYLQIAGLKITLDREWGEQIFFTQEQFTRMVLDGTRGGWQIATHSFSPQANQIVLNGYEAALNGGDNNSLRLRLEHIGTITDEEVSRMADLGIIGSVQFINASALVEDVSFKKYIPAGEIQHTARWRDLLNAGIFLIGNTDDPWCCTDWRNNFTKPAYDATVIQSIYQGVTRTTFSGKQPEEWQILQAVTVQEALEMLTINGAYAAHQEDVIGSLKPGKYADLVIFSGNPLTVPVGQIPDLYVIMTMVGGDVKYCGVDQEEFCR